MSKLSRGEFLQVVDRTPLFSLDLVVRDAAGRVLLGLRKNEPAAGCWFVPGGRVRKGERLAEAFRRLTREELGLERELIEARLLGLYEHLYPTNFAGLDGVSTHYVVAGYEFESSEADLGALPAEQHAGYRWWAVEDLLGSPDVHHNTKAYLRGDGPSE